MPVLEKLAALSEITPQTVQSILTFEDFKFEILEALNRQPNYDKIHSLFYEVDTVMETGEIYNLFNERYILKSLYLSSVYGIDIDFFNGLMKVAPIVWVDKELSELLANDLLFLYVEKLYKDYKIYNGTTLGTLMRYMNKIDLAQVGEELKGSIDKLKELSKEER